jgi:lipoprotein-anchoring transpeptidase ErfK/SrfK
MTLPSQTPRSSSPLSSSARQAQGTRTLFIAVAALGLGGAVAGWLITHRSETPEQAAEATIVDPLVANDTGAPAAATSETATEITLAETGGTAAGAVEVIELGTVAAVTAPAADVPKGTPATDIIAPDAPLGTAVPGIAGTPGAAPITPAGTLGTPAQRLQQALALAPSDAVRARAELTRLLDGGDLSAAERQQAYAGINSVAQQIFLSPTIAPGDVAAQSYVVQRGDSLARIASREKLGIDWRFIQRINGLPNERAIRPDMRLKLAHGPFHAEVVKSEFRFNVYAGAGAERVMVLSMPCGLGENDSTPTGTFRVRKNSKLVNPEWRNPRTGERFAANDPKNPIGERWIGLEGTTAEMAKFTGYGIHGTVDPTSIGRQMSMGCVRLGEREVEVAYELIGSDSTVTIR